MEASGGRVSTVLVSVGSDLLRRLSQKYFSSDLHFLLVSVAFEFTNVAGDDFDLFPRKWEGFFLEIYRK